MIGIKEFLTTLFNNDESICVSQDAFGIQVKPMLEVLNDKNVAQYQYISVNPLLGSRSDANVTQQRNILCEFDPHFDDQGKLISGIPLDQQMAYIKSKQLPYSCITYSGNKSLHAVVCLEDPIPNLMEYRFVAEYLYNVLGGASVVDVKNKNPSRFSRIADGVNQKTNHLQQLLECKGRIPNQVLLDYLNLYPECKPAVKIPQKTVKHSNEPNIALLSSWTTFLIFNGIHTGKRNDSIFKIAFDLFSAGYSLEQAIEFFMDFSVNTQDSDFSEKELITTMTSAYKRFEQSLEVE